MTDALSRTLVAVLLFTTTAPIETRIGHLHGLWTGAGVSILVDVCRHQGRADAKPFEREPLVVIDTTDDFVVFFIGERRFIALVREDEATITGDGLDGSVTLSRSRPFGHLGGHTVSCPRLP